jgi:hypothetical protein
MVGKKQGKVHELFCKRVMGMPSMAANGVCVRELGRTNRKKKVVDTGKHCGKWMR